MSRALLFQWMGDAFIPANPQYAKRADERYVVGETYRLDEPRDRSEVSHNHYFATILEGWHQLPESHARFPSPHHLRKYALIKAGYYHSHTVVCASDNEARELTASMKTKDEFSVIELIGPIVTKYTAKSQAFQKMEKGEFQKSKRDVLEVIARMIDISREELERNAGKAA